MLWNCNNSYSTIHIDANLLLLLDIHLNCLSTIAILCVGFPTSYSDLYS